MWAAWEIATCALREKWQDVRVHCVGNCVTRAAFLVAVSDKISTSTRTAVALTDAQTLQKIEALTCATLVMSYLFYLLTFSFQRELKVASGAHSCASTIGMRRCARVTKPG